MAILSHGERASNEDVIIGTDGRQVSLDDITKPFTNGNICKTLIDKLKLFVVQVPIHAPAHPNSQDFGWFTPYTG